MSRTNFCALFGVVLEALENFHISGDGLLNGHHLGKAGTRDLSHNEVAKSTILGCDSAFDIFEESKNRIVELRAVAAFFAFFQRSVRKERRNRSETRS